MKKLLIILTIVFISGCASFSTATRVEKRKPQRRPLISLIVKPQVNHTDLMISFVAVITIIIFGFNSRN